MRTKGAGMSEQTATVNGLRTVAVPVTDQDRAVAFYVRQLGFHVRMDAPVDQTGGRWIELAPTGSTTTLALAQRTTPILRAPRPESD
jgi:catechol 2,3-dioxygenase-like lactoylglutathione lyase family enzyme